MVGEFEKLFPTNTPRVYHVETMWKRPFPRRFNVEYTWCVCRVPTIDFFDMSLSYILISFQHA